MEMESSITVPEKKNHPKMEIVDVNLEEGASILFTPTGEEWRIYSKEDGQVIFERLQ